MVAGHNGRITKGRFVEIGRILRRILFRREIVVHLCHYRCRLVGKSRQNRLGLFGGHIGDAEKGIHALAVVDNCVGIRFRHAGFHEKRPCRFPYVLVACIGFHL